MDLSWRFHHFEQVTQVGAMANVIIMLWSRRGRCIWIFRNKKEITQHLAPASARWLFSSFIRAFALSGTAGQCLFYCAVFLFTEMIRNSLKFMMGATLRSLVRFTAAAFVSGMSSRIAKTITLSHTQRSYPELQKRLNGWLSTALSVARILTVCVAVMLLLNAWV